MSSNIPSLLSAYSFKFLKSVKSYVSFICTSISHILSSFFCALTNTVALCSAKSKSLLSNVIEISSAGALSSTINSFFPSPYFCINCFILSLNISFSVINSIISLSSIHKSFGSFSNKDKALLNNLADSFILHNMPPTTTTCQNIYCIEKKTAYDIGFDFLVISNIKLILFISFFAVSLSIFSQSIF